MVNNRTGQLDLKAMDDNTTGYMLPVLGDLLEFPGYLMRRAHQIANAEFAARVDPKEITGVQFMALVAILDEEAATSGLVAERIGYDKTTTGQVIHRLEEKGLVTRRSGTRDRREKIVTDLPKGRALARRIKKLLPAVADDLLSPLNRDEQIQLLHLLRRLDLHNRRASPGK